MSLERNEYYAHPQNVFWRIMGQLTGASPALPYKARTQKLTQAGIALWDVCAAGIRPGSLDSDIREPEINDFNAFFNSHPHIQLICFNGAKAAELYRRKALPLLSESKRAVSRETLPSTSPAHANMRFEQKLARWKEALMN